jgi:hypothetical protein
MAYKSRLKEARYQLVISEYMEAAMTTPQGLLQIMPDVAPEFEDEFNQWYEQEHLAERMAIPGFIKARRFRALEGSPKYLALYDLASPDVLNCKAYRHLVGEGRTPWSRRLNLQFKNLSRNVYVAISDRQR